MYSQDKIDVALKVFHQCGSVTTTIRVLGYPTRRALYTWIANEGSAKSVNCTPKVGQESQRKGCRNIGGNRGYITTEPSAGRRGLLGFLHLGVLVPFFILFF